MDLHIHSAASTDYQQPEFDILDMLKKAEEKNLDIMAITDHNTIAGFKQMMSEISNLESLLKLNRILPAEKIKLNEYHRLLKEFLFSQVLNLQLLSDFIFLVFSHQINPFGKLNTYFYP